MKSDFATSVLAAFSFLTLIGADAEIPPEQLNFATKNAVEIRMHAQSLGRSIRPHFKPGGIKGRGFVIHSSESGLVIATAAHVVLPLKTFLPNTKLPVTNFRVDIYDIWEKKRIATLGAVSLRESLMTSIDEYISWESSVGFPYLSESVKRWRKNEFVLLFIRPSEIRQKKLEFSNIELLGPLDSSDGTVYQKVRVFCSGDGDANSKTFKTGETSYNSQLNCSIKIHGGDSGGAIITKPTTTCPKTGVFALVGVISHTPENKPGKIANENVYFASWKPLFAKTGARALRYLDPNSSSLEQESCFSISVQLADFARRSSSTKDLETLRTDQDYKIKIRDLISKMEKEFCSWLQTVALFKNRFKAVWKDEDIFPGFDLDFAQSRALESVVELSALGLDEEVALYKDWLPSNQFINSYSIGNVVGSVLRAQRIKSQGFAGFRSGAGGPGAMYAMTRGESNWRGPNLEIDFKQLTLDDSDDQKYVIKIYKSENLVSCRVQRSQDQGLPVDILFGDWKWHGTVELQPNSIPFQTKSVVALKSIPTMINENAHGLDTNQVRQLFEVSGPKTPGYIFKPENLNTNEN